MNLSQVHTEMSRESPNGYIKQVDGQLIVEPARGTPTQLGEIYRDLAVFCIEKQIRRVLVKPADDDAAGERALRVALTTMVLAGLPAEFKLALVAPSGRIEARYRDTERDLCLAGVDTKMFETEDSAARWLDDLIAD
jgi:hypothetical protein